MNRLSQLRQEKGLNMREAARQLGMPYTTYVNYEKGTREPNSETLISLAKFYGTSIDYLLCKSDSPPGRDIPPGFEPMPKMKKVPLIGAIACGDPITATENREGEIDVPEDIRCDFALRCKGNSMIGAGIHDGDAVYIRIQPEVENGQIAAVRIGSEATLKHFHRQGSTVMLIADNAAVCPPMVYTGPQLEELHIEGRAVGLCRGL